MSTFLAIIEMLATLWTIDQKRRRGRIIDKIDIDTQVVLPILLKELDHIQGIVGRFDNFFFLMKQVCLGGISAIVVVYLTKPFNGLGWLLALPLLFYIFEYFFRYSYWSGYILRILEIEAFLNNGVKNIGLYRLRYSRPIWLRAKKSFKFRFRDVFPAACCVLPVYCLAAPILRSLLRGFFIISCKLSGFCVC